MNNNFNDVIKKLNFDKKERKNIFDLIHKIGILDFQILIKEYSFVDSKTTLDQYLNNRRLSNLFWKHLRKIEVGLKAKYINFFPLNEKAINYYGKVNKDFLNKYVHYNCAPQDMCFKNNKTIIKTINHLFKKHKYKTSSKKTIDFIQNSSLGTFLIFLNCLDEKKIKFKQNKYLKNGKLLSLVTLRNQIAHYHLLSEKFSKKDLINFWEIIKKCTNVNEKNLKKFIRYIKMY